MEESGDFFENILYGKYNGLYSTDAIFLLNINNYNVNFKLFHDNFMDNNFKNLG